MKLSTNFSLKEFKCPCHCGKENEHLEEIKALVVVLQKIRDFFGVQVVVHSGYRCEEFNKACGGVKKSQHLQGRAADIIVKGKSPRAVQAALAGRLKDFGIRGFGKYNRFTHVDIRNGAAKTWVG